MKNFKKINNNEYHAELRDKLSIENLKKSAHELKDGSRLISIDFFGIAATTLFDAGGNYAKMNVYEQLKNLLFAHPELNKDGYFIRIRLLFEYPYSISSYSRIQAEYNTDRASIDETAYSRKFSHTEPVDLDLFKSSKLVTTQMSSLMIIQSLMDDLEKMPTWKQEGLSNKITLRFTPVNPSFCCLFINKDLYFDVYLMAKKQRYHNALKRFAPVIGLNADDDTEEIKAFKDHFRYLWDLDTTIHYKDATKYVANKANSMAKVKSPLEISNDYRARKLLNYFMEDFNEDDATRWAVISKKNIQKFCADFTPSTHEEVMFVTCSWERDKDKESRPNIVARTLVKDWLTKDLNKSKDLIDFQILRAATTDLLDEQLYEGLDKATMGLIILTKDIEGKDGKFYSRPNVYHELGYLMNRLSNKNIIILKEEGAVIPSNVQNIPYISFTREELILNYYVIIESIRKISNYSNLHQINALNLHLQRLQEELNAGNIDNKSFRANVRKIKETIEELKTAPNNV